MKQVAPFGAWGSPITSDLIVSASVRLGEIALDGQDIYWSESRPEEGGRSVIVRRTPDGEVVDVIPADFNARTRVHEYGGGAFLVIDGVVYFCHFGDQRLYRQEPGAEPQAITPEADLRYADGIVDRRQDRIICVQEDHTSSDREAVNRIVAIDLAGEHTQKILVEGNDFYAAPRLSPDGSKLAWLTWNHPRMPWDGTQLWVAEVTADGCLGSEVQVAGGQEESIFQPEWSPDGVLYFVSDRSGWWNLYRWRPLGPSSSRKQVNETGQDLESGPVASYGGEVEQVEAVCERVPERAEFGVPQWVFGLSTYGFDSAQRLVCAYTVEGIWHLASVDLETGHLEPIKAPYSSLGGVRVGPGYAVMIGGSPTEPSAIVRLDLESGNSQMLRRSSVLDLEPDYLSEPRAIEFPTERGLTAHALYYRPQNRDYTGPADERPPLLVISHGGPTSATSSALKLGIQYWTSRGIAVLDVNYGGSTGYGREYRERLNGQWGVVDVDDCVNGALHLVEQGEVDKERLIIRGGSAGGYTTLCALTFRDVFKAGASYYGVSDLAALAEDTHKFESRYLDRMVGPYPEKKELYRERSPIHFIDRLACPVIFFQGMDDKVVPPNQTELMVEALRAKGVPVAYLPFEGEQHGFRRAENIKRALEAELHFYGRIFGFEPASPIEPVDIENL